MLTTVKVAFIAMGFLLVSGCATQETRRVVEGDKVETYGSRYDGPKTAVVVGKFENRSDYLQGLFSSGVDRLGNQSKTILKAHLQQTNHFSVMDRDTMEESKREAELRGVTQNIKGARYTVNGAVSEFGRKNTGDHQLFGILGSGKKQTAYAKVTLNVVDIVTSEVVYSVQGAGEYALDSREVVGFGTSAGYDATLNGKVLNLAITEAVNNLVRGKHSWGATE